MQANLFTFFLHLQTLFEYFALIILLQQYFSCTIGVLKLTSVGMITECGSPEKKWLLVFHPNWCKQFIWLK